MEGQAKSVSDSSRELPDSGAAKLSQAHSHVGSSRILTIVSQQLTAADSLRPEQWDRQRPFICGYIDALVDMHVSKSGKMPQGKESRALTALILEELLDDAWNDGVMWTFDAWARQLRSDFLLGRATAIDDYQNWDTRPMMGIARRLLDGPPAVSDGQILDN